MTTSTATTIPGVVDGTVTPTVDAEGNISLHIEVRNGPGRSEGGDYIEVVLTGGDARALLAASAAAPAPRSQAFPCSVGVRLQSGPSLSSSL
ncbi:MULTISPECIES: hypothetical protein [unclassified Streptomyces]|uniref:hypothetical protein n=1 Tax=unclassified Streptomyces TaxID=2593676 RepID=UPI002E31ADD5|nr:hypothetical protein [Streptomyces sp. NBC_01268]